MTEIQAFNGHLAQDWKALALSIDLGKKSENTKISLVQQASVFHKWLKDNDLLNSYAERVVPIFLKEKGQRSLKQRIWALRILFLHLPEIKHNDLAQIRVHRLMDSFRAPIKENAVNDGDYLSPEEIQHMATHEALKYEQSPNRRLSSFRNLIITLALFDTGCRITELIEIRHSDIKITPQGRYSILVTGKGNKERTVLMQKITYDLVRTYLPDHRELLFATRNGTQLNRSHLYNAITKLTKSHFHRALGPHALRHSKAMEMIKRGLSPQKVQKYLGHTDVATTLSYYVHERPEEGDVFE